ncbi:NUDIX domain-containing protein [Nocardioides sp. zg-1228]|uniref:NUDIX domain-containing protein n=1 Tax=Nocardioides sp. zg-1228 TaxID=2763008 RepID=UPI001642CF85|nr:NUDIX domain-containing protein [Nocardioides sp. zg-1228]MBC2931541.1 NUDIX domain-containing protein [Nocardioides sp. zg-1228]QSF57143.1 NUDIX domain-containing protein [Nocardioides sp. zg-1228]
MSDHFALVPASYVYLLRESPGGTEVLLQRRGPVPYMPGHWAAGAAGHVEPGETAYDAARREALEELGITDLELDFVLTMQRSQFGPAIEERVDWFFTSRSWTGEPRIVEPEKCAEQRWCRLDDLPEPMVPHEAHALAHLFSGVGYLTFGWDAPPPGGGPGGTGEAGSPG